MVITSILGKQNVLLTDLVKSTRHFQAKAIIRIVAQYFVLMDFYKSLFLSIHYLTDLFSRLVRLEV